MHGQDRIKSRLVEDARYKMSIHDRKEWKGICQNFHFKSVIEYDSLVHFTKIGFPNLWILSANIIFNNF